MARIRTIKPDFPHSESMGSVSRDARLTFIMIWTIADDSGRLRGNSRMLASLLFPYDADAPSKIDEWLEELAKEQTIIRYQKDGSSYIQICNWLIHQRIDKPSQSKIPGFDEDSTIIREGSKNSREGSTLEGKGREGKGKEGNKDSSPADADVLPFSPTTNPSPSKPKQGSIQKPDSVSQDVWDSFAAVRKAKRAPLTQIALDGISREAGFAGISLNDALTLCCERGWQSFDHKWLQAKTGRAPQDQHSRLLENNRNAVNTWLEKEGVGNAC